MAEAPTLELGLRAFATLAAVLGSIVLLAWGLRRTGLVRAGGGAAPGRLELVAAKPLDGRTRLLLVRCDERLHLLAAGPAGVTVVDSRDATPAQVGSAAA